VEPDLRTTRPDNGHCRIGNAFDYIEQWIRHITQLDGVGVGHEQCTRLDRVFRLTDESKQFTFPKASNPRLRRWGHVAYTVDEKLELDAVPSLSGWRRQKFDGVTHAKSAAPLQYLEGRCVKTESESVK